MKSVHLAIDLGAGSGRILAGIFENETLRLEEVHRFENPGTHLPGGLFWNILGLYRDILEGLRLAAKTYGDSIKSAGIDTWAVDYGLLDEKGRLLGFPHQYRDPRTTGMEKRADELIGNQKIYETTGIMPFFLNTSLQLLSEAETDATSLREARQFLMIPDLLAYWLTGKTSVELTNASTTQLYNPVTRDWAWEVIEGLGLPRRIFGKIVPPGTLLGNLRPEVIETVRQDFPIVATTSHDTAAAVAGIPGEGKYAFISSGTWAIIGTELPAPILTEEARATGFANEQGIEGTTRFLKNISGLWLIQECKRHWNSEGEDLSYKDLASLADGAPRFTAFIDPDDPLFAAPGHMPEKVVDYCRETNQAVPTDKGTILRICSDSIALKHRLRFDQLKSLTDLSLDRIHMGGGGIQNRLLTQAICNACGVPLFAGPIEATACGNLITQLVALGKIPDIAAGRALLKKSLPLEAYEPLDSENWNAAFTTFQKVTSCEP